MYTYGIFFYCCPDCEYGEGEAWQPRLPISINTMNRSLNIKKKQACYGTDNEISEYVPIYSLCERNYCCELYISTGYW